MSSPITRVGDYLIFHPHIGKGSFSKVYRGQSVLSNDTLAIKKITRSRLTSNKLVEYIEKEINIIKCLHHKNIVEYKDLILDEKNIFIVTEYCNGGTLKEIIDETTIEWKSCMIQIKDAIEYLHKNNIFHRDIKPQNIFVTYNDSDILHRNNILLKLGDFGFAKNVNYSDDENVDMGNTLCGTPMYMAPEMMCEKKPHVLSDMWSLGVIFFQLLYKKYPFGNPGKGNLPRNIMELLRNIDQQQQNFTNQLKINPTNSVQNMILRMLIKNPSHRLTWNEFFTHSLWNPPQVLCEINKETNREKDIEIEDSIFEDEYSPSLSVDMIEDYYSLDSVDDETFLSGDSKWRSVPMSINNISRSVLPFNISKLASVGGSPIFTSINKLSGSLKTMSL